MKKIFILFLILNPFFCFTSLYAQQTIEFGYDASGNRITRNVLRLTTKETDEIITDTISSYKEGPVNNKTLPATFTDNLGDQIVTIFPNPTKGTFTIRISNLSADKSCNIILRNLNGQLLYSNKNASEITEIDINHEPKGVYLLDVLIGNKASLDFLKKRKNREVKWHLS